MDESIPENKKVVGRTWVDLWVSGGYLFVGLVFIILVFIGVYYFYGSIPRWIFISMAMSLAFVPFLFERAKEDSQLFIVCDEPLKMTEYRIGSKVNLDIEGIPARMVSRSGISRFILKQLNPNNLHGVGSPLGEYSQFEQIRTMTTLQSVTNKLEDVLREDRLTSMAMGLEVEKQSKEVVDWALRVIYGASIPTELNEALGIDLEGIGIDESIEDVVE